MFSLKEWQQIIKPKHDWLYNCSECKYKNDEWVPFPIGMGWSIINDTGSVADIQIGSHDKLVLCAIHPDTDKRRRHTGKNRASILDTLRSNQIENQYLIPYNYFRELPQYKFVISPEGNGVDCHRHYEALMAGCIPIVEDSQMIRDKYKGSPILYTTDYSEITEEYLIKKYDEMAGRVYDFSRLFLHHYSESNRKEIKKNGNYWAKTLAHTIWYE
jgi:hypothetical protein